MGECSTWNNRWPNASGLSLGAPSVERNSYRNCYSNCSTWNNCWPNASGHSSAACSVERISYQECSTWNILALSVPTIHFQNLRTPNEH